MPNLEGMEHGAWGKGKDSREEDRRQKQLGTKN